MCNKRYISKPKNKEIESVSRKTDSPMSLLSCSRFSGWIPIWSMDAIPRNPSYSASFSPLIFLLHYPFLIPLYLWLNMYFSKDADSVPTFESPWIHQGWTPADDRGWDGWMASRTWWTWVWVNSGRWWWTGRPCVLWFMRSQIVEHDWATELNWTSVR